MLHDNEKTLFSTSYDELEEIQEEIESLRQKLFPTAQKIKLFWSFDFVKKNFMLNTPVIAQ